MLKSIHVLFTHDPFLPQWIHPNVSRRKTNAWNQIPHTLDLSPQCPNAEVVSQTLFPYPLKTGTSGLLENWQRLHWIQPEDLYVSSAVLGYSTICEWKDGKWIPGNSRLWFGHTLSSGSQSHTQTCSWHTHTHKRIHTCARAHTHCLITYSVVAGKGWYRKTLWNHISYFVPSVANVHAKLGNWSQESPCF